MRKLEYSEAELLREHDYAHPHEVMGYRLHGGFDEAGRYLSPRTAVRWDAVHAWEEALVERGGAALAADRSLLGGASFPSYEQQKLLLREGLGRTLWNSLTITGVIEARGRVLAQFQAPDFSTVLAEGVSGMAVGHLNRGLLKAHGLDEGGSPEKGIGGHDAMWFAVRDLVFGAERYPIPEVPENIGRPDGGRRMVGEIPQAHEQMLLFLMNLLMIEIRAELVFDFNRRLFRDPELFVLRRREAEQAAVLVDRIRQDEQIHVDYLRTVLGEIRSATFVGPSGWRARGAEVIDSVWAEIVRWHTVERPKLVREETRRSVQRQILGHPDGERILEQFEALAA
jgi:hypothetical protein